MSYEWQAPHFRTWPTISTWQVLGVEELVTVLGDRPHSKSTDYDEFVNAAWTPPTAAVEPAVAPAAAAVPGPGEQSDGPR